MARVFRATYTVKGRNGTRVTKTARKWYVEYVDADGITRRKPGYSDKGATQQLAADLQRQVERERAGIIDQTSIALSRELSAGIDRHVEAYSVYLQSSEVSAWHLSESMRRLRRVIAECRFVRLTDVKAEPVQRWLVLRQAETMGPRTRNTYTGSLRAFIRWCIADSRMASDPLMTLNRADESADVRRQRRALTEAELSRLLHVAEHRPLSDVQTIRRGKRKGEHVAKVRLNVRARLERLGRERGLIYRTLVLTGLRRGELAGLTWGDVSLDGQQAWLTVRACVAKNGKAEPVPVRADLAVLLRVWRTECGKPGDGARVFDVPKQLVAILHRDIEAAGIDPTGVDVHSLRHTTATYLAKAGVAPRTAQAIMRHSDIRLTLGTYTDPRLLDTAKAMDALPRFDRPSESERLRATGTTDAKPDAPALGVLLGVSARSNVHNRSSACADAGKATESGDDRKPLRMQELSQSCASVHNSGRRDSNAQLSAWKADALPIELHPRRHGIDPSSRWGCIPCLNHAGDEAGRDRGLRLPSIR